MLGKTIKYLLLLLIIAAVVPTAQSAGPPQYDPCTGDATNSAAGYRGISKVKPSSAEVLKVKPYSGLSAGFGAISSLSPANWWQQCCLPSPAPKQFVLGGRVLFARVRGEVRRRYGMAAGVVPSLVDFDEHLQLPKSGQTMWSVMAHYQFQPRWGIRYSFTPLVLEGSGTPSTSFNFLGQTFNAGTPIHSKWERYEHRAGLVFDLSHTTNSVASLFAEWLYIQDKLSVGSTGAGVVASTWDSDKNLAVMGCEFSKCLKNYRGSTLALNTRGGIAFLQNHIGYEAEAALSYIIPVKRGRFGYIKSGYHYAMLKREKDVNLFRTTMDGAFLEVGFLF